MKEGEANFNLLHQMMLWVKAWFKMVQLLQNCVRF